LEKVDHELHSGSYRTPWRELGACVARAARALHDEDMVLVERGDALDAPLLDEPAEGVVLSAVENSHEARIGSPAWNNNVLTTGGMDGKIVNNDVRIRNHVVQTYEGHTQ
jgi:hypothetical protein